MIWAKKRFKVLERDNFRCQYCWKNGKDVSLEVDHIIPKSKGWTDDFDNLITCCRECNIWKWKDIIWVSNWIAKIKIADHENAMIKKFFSEWNELSFGTIDKHNLSFISWFIKLSYWNYLKWYIEQYLWDKWKEFIDFDKWWKLCDEVLKMFDNFIRDNELNSILHMINQKDRWNTDDINLILNRLISEKIVYMELPKSFNLKYSLFPKQIEQWQIEREKILKVFD